MKVLLGLSGGFDSAYSARLLMDAGYTVEGAVLDMHEHTETEEARISAENLGIPLHRIPCRALFSEVVMQDFCDEYLAARTPNPCVVCNERVKFRVLADYAKANGFDKIATGHYAQICRKDGRIAIASAVDRTKDQSYMLYRLAPDILEMLALPMGNIIKKEAKMSQAAEGLLAVEREESQEICFVKGESYTDFIEKRCGTLPTGHFVSSTGEILGEHRGIVHYTVGQRKGLGVSAATRLFVKEIDLATGDILLVDTAPKARRFSLEKTVFSGSTREEVLEKECFFVRVRYTAPLASARIWEENGELWCELLEETRAAVTPGQSAVFYFDDMVAFGGVITKLSY